MSVNTDLASKRRKKKTFTTKCSENEIKCTKTQTKICSYPHVIQLNV